MTESQFKSFGKAFSEGVRVILGKGGTHALEDSIPDTIKRANEIRQSRPAATWQSDWQTTLASQEVDFIRFIDKDRILVGTIEPTNIMGHPKHDGVSLFHASDGREIWRATRDPFPDGAYALLATDPTIILYGSNESKGLLFILDPQTGEELGQLRIEVSVLSTLRTIRYPEEVRIGRHGLVVRQGARSGLLLPQVAQEHGWRPREFLARTCEKAGLPPNAWQDKSTQVFVFSATVFGEERELAH